MNETRIKPHENVITKTFVFNGDFKDCTRMSRNMAVHLRFSAHNLFFFWQLIQMVNMNPY